ncbi:MAG TPA: glycosyltransferase family 39 protein [Polyangiaceae bacterium]|nr:glycosyltransferase family 39 protein [Polyangiaceae bacterium]
MLRATLARVLDWLSADRSTLPPAAPLAERASTLVVVLATVWFALAALWEIAAPFGAGHYAAATAVATGGENMSRWGVIGPIPHYTLAPPRGADFYCHHPWGIFWTAAAFVKLFGHHDFVCRLPAVLMSAAMPALLFAIARAAWGVVAGAAAAVGFVVLPIALSYANFFTLEVPVMFGLCLGMWGYLRLVQSGRRRFLITGLVGLIYAMHADWAAFVFGALLLSLGFVRWIVLRRYFVAIPFRRYAVYWSVAACLALASAAFYLLSFQGLGQLEQFLRQGEFRTKGSHLPLADVLESRRLWLETMFTPVAIFLGKVGAVVLALRSVLVRRDGEWLPLCVLGMAVFQYVVFKNGADIHIFWPHYFALYFALALGALTRTLEVALAGFCKLLKRPQLAVAASLVSLGLALLVSAVILPDGVRALGFARKTGGRFNEQGHIIHPDIDKEKALEYVAERLPTRSQVLLHRGMKQSYFMDWVLQRPVETRAPGRSTSADRFYLVDARFASAEELDVLIDRHSVTVLGPFWFVDRNAARRLQTLRIARREPGPLERFFVLGSHAAREVEADPWSAWELTVHFQEVAVAPPRSEPVTFEELRIAHNQALSAGEEARATALLARLLQGTDRASRCRYADGSELLAVRYEQGASDVLSVYLKAGEARGTALKDDELRFGMEAIVEDAPAWSTVMADPVIRDVGLPSTIPIRRWRPGFVYSSITEVLKRPGRERFVAGFRGSQAPSPEGCSPDQTVLVLED